MAWEVQYHPEFRREHARLALPVQIELEAAIRDLTARGPTLGRPHADTLNGSRYRNMKELRFRAARGVWRVAFAFDPDRIAILLVATNKRGQNQRRLYGRFIRIADARYADHLAGLSEGL